MYLLRLIAVLYLLLLTYLHKTSAPATFFIKLCKDRLVENAILY